MIVILLKVIFLVLCTEYLSAEELVIEIPDGKIKGYTQTTVSKTVFYLFQGIPFGQAPVGDLRFQAPKPAKPWEGILDATSEGDMCYQVSRNYTNENEDCLFINVFTPTNPLRNSSLPVMFFIYGGAFKEGWSETIYFGPHHLMDHGVILVTFNYRVGPFGFFSTGDDAIPGNAGLKDQNLALQWVQKNIKYFGGDPEKVTIFGESAGAASVGYQLLSPKSKGLFRAAILESGTALNPWAYQRKQVEFTYQTVGYIDPSYNNANVSTSDLLEFLKGLPAKAIKDASITLANTESAEYITIQHGVFYGPVIEHDHEDAFISKPMYELLEAGDINNVPIIIGINSEEAEFFADDEANLKAIAQTFDKDPTHLNPLDMHIHDKEIQDKVAEEIENLYSPGANFEENPLKLISYFSDQSFMRSAIKHAELQSRINDVFFYQFSYSGVLGQQVKQSVQGFSNTVRHAEELNYIFAHNYGGLNTTDLSKYPTNDRLVANRFITMFTNFAKTLNPTPIEDENLENVLWPKVNSIYFPYLDIGSYSRVKLHPRNNTYSAWGAIYDKYAEKPYDTY